MATIYSLPNELWLEIAEQLVLSCGPADPTAAFASISNLSQTCTHLYPVASTALYLLDARKKSYALYWACVAGRVDTLRMALDAGADPDTRWLVARNGQAADMIADSELVGDGEMDILDDLEDDEEDEFAYGGGVEEDDYDGDEDIGTPSKAMDRFWAIPELDMANVLQQRHLCRTNGALGRMLYTRAEGQLATKVSDPADRELLRDAHLMRDGCVDVPITTAAFSMVSALHLAVYLEHIDVVEELLDHGADVNQTSRSLCSSASPDWLDNTVTALDYAVGRSHIELARVLLSCGARLGAVGVRHIGQHGKFGARNPGPAFAPLGMC